MTGDNGDRGQSAELSAEAERRAAQDAAAELARMGIDPTALGLEPAPAKGARTAPARGVSAIPSDTAGADALDTRDPRSDATTLTFINRPLTDQPAPSWSLPVPPPEYLTEPLEDATTTHKIVLPERWHRIIRAFTLGLVKPGAAEAIERERRLMARIRTRRREPVIVAFVSGKGGAGTTTTAAGIGLSLAANRTDNITLVDARCGTSSLGRRLAGRPAPSTAQLSEPEDAPPQNLLPLRTRGLLGLVDAPPWHMPISPARVIHVLDRLRVSQALTLVDIGADLTQTAQAVLGRADQIVLVTTTSQDAIDAARTALGRIWQEAPHRLNTIIVAIACLTSNQYRHTLRKLRAEPGLTSRTVAVPFDPALSAGGPLDPSDLRPATREAFLSLAALVADPGPPDRELRAGYAGAS